METPEPKKTSHFEVESLEEVHRAIESLVTAGRSPKEIEEMLYSDNPLASGTDEVMALQAAKEKIKGKFTRGDVRLLLDIYLQGALENRQVDDSEKKAA